MGLFVGAGLIWILLCFGIGVLATFLNRNGLLFFLLAMVISPLLGGILLLAFGKKSSNSNSGGAPKLKCPKCGTVNDPQARYCQGCGVQIVGAKTNPS